MSLDLVLEHCELALLVATWLAIGALAVKRRYDSQQRRFAQQIGFSLNALDDEGGSTLLRLRTNSADMDSVRSRSERRIPPGVPLIPAADSRSLTARCPTRGSSPFRGSDRVNCSQQPVDSTANAADARQRPSQSWRRKLAAAVLRRAMPALKPPNHFTGISSVVAA